MSTRPEDPLRALDPPREIGARLQAYRADLGRAWVLVRKSVAAGVFPGAGAIPGLPYHRVPFPVRLRRLLEELGLTYLKLGQFLALRYDVFPAEVCRELAQLFEAVPPLSPEEARRALEAELGGPPLNFFAEFEERPLAAASVAQVHRARLRDGRAVAVKLQRPGLKPIFLADIRNLRRLARLADLLGLLGRLSAQGLVTEFARWTLRELDFRVEGQTACAVRAHAQPFEVVPRVYWELSTERLLTLEFVHGLSVARAAEILEREGLQGLERELPDLDLPRLLERLTRAAFAQIFLSGLFHGDPHPGNILVCPGNRVAFIDFGIFGQLTEEQREVVAGQLECTATGDLAQSLRYYSRQLVVTAETDPGAFFTECLDRLRRWYATALDPAAPMEERHLAKLTGDMIDISRRHGMRYGLNYVLFWRALNEINATVWRLDPGFDMVGELRAFFLAHRAGPLGKTATVVRSPRWRQTVLDLVEALPDRLAAGLERAAAGEPGWVLERWESAAARAEEHHRARWGSLGLAAFSLFLVSTRGQLPPAALAALAAVLLAPFLWLLSGLLRRSP